MSRWIELDGAQGEGGGQILRTSLALSLLTGQPFRLRNIRAGRANPGLQPQHLKCVQASAAIGQAAVRGASRGSSELHFEPGPVQAGRYRFDIGTAGAVSLVLHTLYLPLALRGGEPSVLTLTGGTHVKASPAYHFLETTWAAHLARFGLAVDLTLFRPGFYPRGGGQIEATIHPCEQLRPTRLLSRTGSRVTGVSVAARLPDSIAERQARRATVRLRDRGMDADITLDSWDAGPGTVLMLRHETDPVPALFVALGERGKPAEKVADEAVDELLAHHAVADAPVDPHSADQILLPLALADGKSEYRVSTITRHLTTNAAVIRRFLDREITIDGDESEPGVVRIA